MTRMTTATTTKMAEMTAATTTAEMRVMVETTMEMMTAINDDAESLVDKDHNIRDDFVIRDRKGNKKMMDATSVVKK